MTKQYKYRVVDKFRRGSQYAPLTQALNNDGIDGYKVAAILDKSTIIMEKEVVTPDKITEDQCLARLVELVDSGSKSGSRRARQCIYDLYDQIRYYEGKEI